MPTDRPLCSDTGAYGSQPRVLITAGPTHEPIDAVRYIANRSSGQMGIALAAEAVRRRWPVTLLLGPTPHKPPENSHLRSLRFQTTADLQQLLREHWPSHDVLFMAAAVADYTAEPAQSQQKLKRSDQPLTLRLIPTPDLLADLASLTRPDQTTIGFALEPAERLLESALGKLERKRLDAIVANPLETMDAPDITARVILRTGEIVAAPPRMPKGQFAAWLMDLIEPLVQRRRQGKDSAMPGQSSPDAEEKSEESNSGARNQPKRGV